MLRNNLDPQALGLLSMSLMNQGGNQNFGNTLLNAALQMQSMQSPQQGAPLPAPIESQQQTVNSSATTMPLSLPADRQQMLAMLKGEAAKAYPDNPIMQQVAITQAIHESGLMGKPSQLAMRDNNLFGIKAPGSSGMNNWNTTEYSNGQPQTVRDGFGRNASIGDSFSQYQRLMNANRYKPVMAAQNPYAAFSALQQAGYATDPNYSKNLSRVYSQYVAPLY